jgi:lipopolysaccharide transport system ATP-binding protein
VSKPVIKVENLSKQYRIGERESYKTFREAIVRAFRTPYHRMRGALGRSQNYNPMLSAPRSTPSALSPKQSPDGDTIWALKDISFEVKQGEVIGIIGRNGAGKSTLLKILSKITEPTSGRVELKGRVGSLLEVGTGFHPELTGHENIYLYGAILGMDRWEVTRKFHEIVAFAEIEKFIDTPVKRYSSGMYMRLAFAVAAHLDPEILLVDEVLAVGDAAFQKKCLGKMGDVSKQGRTVLFVSHNMAAVQKLCESGLVLDDGKVVFNGNAAMAVEKYLGSVTDQDYGYVRLSKDPGRLSGMRPNIQWVAIHRKNDLSHYRPIIKTGDDVIVKIGYDCGEVTLDYAVIGICSSLGERILTVGTHLSPGFRDTMHGKGVLECFLPKLLLVGGEYSVMVAMGINTPRHNICCVDDALRFQVESGDYFKTGFALLRGQGHFAQKSTWRLILGDDDTRQNPI